MGIAEEAIKQITSADDAGMVAAQIMSAFGLVGTVFAPEDITERLDEYSMSDDEREAFVAEYMSSRDWRYISDRTTEAGNWLLGEDIAERMREV